MVTVSNSAEIENQKVLRALRVCETTDGASIQEDKIYGMGIVENRSGVDGSSLCSRAGQCGQTRSQRLDQTPIGQPQPRRWRN